MPEEAFNGSVKPSLEDVAWGLLSLRDKGEALERAFALHADARNADLHELATKVDKNFPVVIFNATMVEAARPLVFSNSAFPYDSQEVERLRSSMQGFDRQCANQDANVETSVRMSATFPFVSPAARAHLDCLSAHLVDGGYYDNSGITALNTWLRQAVGRERWECKEKDPRCLAAIIPEILLLQIVSFPKDSDPAPSDEYWLYQATAPIEAMLNVRGKGQSLRNEAESWALMQNIINRGGRIRTVVFRYAPDDCACSAKAPSLSWHLSTPEIKCIRTAWEENKMQPCRHLVAEFVKSASGGAQSKVCED